MDTDVTDDDDRVEDPDFDVRMIDNSGNDSASDDEGSNNETLYPNLGKLLALNEESNASSVVPLQEGEASTPMDLNNEANVSNEQQCRKVSTPKKPRRICPYCLVWQTHLKRHLLRKHGEEENVMKAKSLPICEQDRAFAAIRKEGIYKDNMKNVRDGKTLVRERTQGKSQTVMCSGCLGFYDQKTIFRHKNNCTKDNADMSSTINLTPFSDNAKLVNVDEKFKAHILDKFRDDAAGSLCRTDIVVLLLGKRAYSKSTKKERSVIMNEMRTFANLILATQKYSSNLLSGLDILNYKNVDIIEKAINDLTYSEEQCKPGLRVRLGFLIKKAVKVMRGYFVTKGDFDEEEEMTRFLRALDLNWDFIFYTAQIDCESKREGLRKPSAMPLETDISKMKDFISQQINKILDTYEVMDTSDFIMLRNLILTRITMFNAGRGGEPARLTLKEWKDAITDAWVDEDKIQTIDDPIEKFLLRDMKLAYQIGKGSRKMVPVLIPNDCIEPVIKLLNERSNCDVHPNNPFLFPNTKKSLDHTSGYHSLKAIVELVPDLTSPRLLIADKFRHRVSTVFANLDLPEDQRKIFMRHMGHSENINKNVYQCPLAIQEITKVGKFLSSLDSDIRYAADKAIDSQATTSQSEVFNGNVSDDTIIMNSEATTSQSEAFNASISDDAKDINSEATTSQSEAFDTTVNDEDQVLKVKKRGKERKYTRWTESDTNLVLSYFSKYITDTKSIGQLPSKKEVSEFLASHTLFKTVPNELRYKLVRTKIFNEKKKYRMGCCPKL